jgi:Bacterial SH3 domain
MNWSALVKLLVGFSLAIALLFFAGVSTTRYLITRLTAPPPRPSFPNDDPNFTLSPSPAQAQSPAAATSPAASPAAATSSPTPTPSVSPTATPTPSPDEPGAYEARVTQSIGLVVRQEPSRSAPQAGGVSYNQSIVVLETSADGEWLRVRVGDSGLEGWIKAGNTEPIN